MIVLSAVKGVRTYVQKDEKHDEYLVYRAWTLALLWLADVNKRGAAAADARVGNGRA